MPNLDHETIELIFIGVTALAVLVQTIILLAIFLAVRKGIGSLKEEVEEIRSSVMPVIDTTRDLLKRLTPKLEQTVSDLSGMAKGLREQSADVEACAKEIVVRVRQQTARMDGMVSSALNAVDQASGFVAEAVNKPLRQLSGLLASVKAIIESLRASDPSRRARAESDETEPFI